MSYKLDSKKIDSTLKSLETAGKNAVAALNGMTDGEFKGSPMETEPLGYLGLIVRTLQEAKGKVEANARFEGKSAEEVSAMQEQERLEQETAIQKKFNNLLAEHNQAQAAPAEEVDEQSAPTDEMDEEAGQDSQALADELTATNATLTKTQDKLTASETALQKANNDLTAANKLADEAKIKADQWDAYQASLHANPNPEQTQNP